MEQKNEIKNKFVYSQPTNFQQGQKDIREKKISSIKGVGKIAYAYAK